MKTLTDYTQYLNNKTTKKKVIAPVESSSTASQAYTVGKKFFYNNILYKATADIAQGGLIVPDTNCTPANTIIEDIDELDSQMQTLTNQVKDMNNVYGSKNLLPFDIVNIIANNTGGTWSGKTCSYRGVTFTLNDDGSITANGTATADAEFRIQTLSNHGEGIKEILGKSVIYNGCPSGGSTSTYQATFWTSTTGTFADNGNGVQFDVPSNMLNNNFTIAIVVRSGYTASNLTFYPMIRLASIKDDTYEPYAKTNQQLTKETTTLITNLNANGCKNHLKVNVATYTKNGITITVNADGSVTLNGTCSTGASFGIVSGSAWSMNKGTYRNVAIIDSGTITCPSGKNVYYTSKYNGTQYTIGFSNTSSKVTRVSPNPFTIANDGDTIDVYFYVDTGVVFNNCTIYPMILDSDCTDYSWSPYAKTNKELTDELTIGTVSATRNTDYLNGTNAVTFRKYGKMVSCEGYFQVTTAVDRNEVLYTLVELPLASSFILAVKNTGAYALLNVKPNGTVIVESNDGLPTGFYSLIGTFVLA